MSFFTPRNVRGWGTEWSVPGAGVEGVEGRVAPRVGLLLFTYPGVKDFCPIHDAAAWTHSETRWSLPPVAPDIEV